MYRYSPDEKMYGFPNGWWHRSSSTSLKDYGSHWMLFWNDRLFRLNDGRANMSMDEVDLRRGGKQLVDPDVPLNGDPDGSLLLLDTKRPGVQCLATTIGRTAALVSPAACCVDVADISCDKGIVARNFPFGRIERTTCGETATIDTKVLFLDTDVVGLYVDVNTASNDTVVQLSGTTLDDNRVKSVQRIDARTIELSVNPAFLVTGANPDFQTIHQTDILPAADFRALVRVTVPAEDLEQEIVGGTEVRDGRRVSMDAPVGYQFRGVPHSPQGMWVIIAMGHNDEAVAEKTRAGQAVVEGKTGEEVWRITEAQWDSWFSRVLNPLTHHVEGRATATGNKMPFNDRRSTTVEQTPVYQSAPETKHQDLLRHAAAVLRQNHYVPHGGFMNGRHASYCVRGNALCVAHYWDSCFSAVALSLLNEQWSHDAIRIMLDNANRYGAPPEVTSRYARTSSGQAPIEAWAAWRVYERTRDREFLEAVYRGAKKYNDYWLQYRDADGDGLCEWRNGGQIGDDSPRWDSGDRVRNNQDMWEYESPDLAGFLHSQLYYLERMADELGWGQEQVELRSLRDRIRHQALSTLYFPEHQSFLDVHTVNHEPSVVFVPNHFIPLWGGIYPDKGSAREIIQKHLLDPDLFFSYPPFPSVSRSDERYNPNGYWRGRVWPHFAYWMVEVLWMFGFHDEADEAADNLLDLLGRYPYLQENYAGNGLPAGIPEYNWTAASAILLALRMYRGATVI